LANKKSCDNTRVGNRVCTDRERTKRNIVRCKEAESMVLDPKTKRNSVRFKVTLDQRVGYHHK